MEAGKTKIRYRDVDIGLVESAHLSDNMDKVLVTAKWTVTLADMLRDDTRLAVRARVGARAVSNLGTCCPAYIQPRSGVPGKAIESAVYWPGRCRHRRLRMLQGKG